VTGRSHQRLICGAAITTLIALAGCGGARQDANEPAGTFKVSVPNASFPIRQHIAQPSQMRISVRNDDSRTVPNVAVTVNSFNYVSAQAGLADPRRPVWIVDAGPTGGTTAYVQTWALGPLAPGQTKTFTWRLTAVQSGTYTVNYRVAAGLNGKAVAQLADGNPPEGSFAVRISARPPLASVNPQTGQVVTTPPPAAAPNVPRATGY
jgi:hypothetical protein